MKIANRDAVKGNISCKRDNKRGNVHQNLDLKFCSKISAPWAFVNNKVITVSFGGRIKSRKIEYVI